MIKTDYLRTTTDGKVLVKTYSDKNYLIKKTNSDMHYDIAVDIGYYDSETECYKPSYYTYEETEELIKKEEDFIKEKEIRG